MKTNETRTSPGQSRWHRLLDHNTKHVEPGKSRDNDPATMRCLASDLRHIETLAFGRRARSGPLLEQFHLLAPQIRALPPALSASVWNIYDWLLVPFSLWPVDFEGLAAHVLTALEPPTLSSTSLVQLLRLIDPPPAPETQSIVAAFEHDVQSGRYEEMLQQAAKFDEQEKALLQNEQLAAEWAGLKRAFDIRQFQNARGVIRRRMSLERNLREAGWPLDWADPRNRFQFFFDAFCYRWKLYGMEHDRPLLLKISVNPTPHGTMIFIPRHWSFDPRRDLDWRLITRLHRSRGAKKQGPKLSPARTEKLAEAKKVRKLLGQGRDQGLKGDALHQFICQEMKHDARSDQSWWRRLLENQKPFPTTGA